MMRTVQGSRFKVQGFEYTKASASSQSAGPQATINIPILRDGEFPQSEGLHQNGFPNLKKAETPLTPSDTLGANLEPLTLNLSPRLTEAQYDALDYITGQDLYRDHNFRHRVVKDGAVFLSIVVPYIFLTGSIHHRWRIDRSGRIEMLACKFNDGVRV